MVNTKMNPETKQMTADNKGFSLIELLIVMALLLIMAALAVPNYMAALSRANEASAASSVRAIITAQSLYRNTFGVYSDLPALGGDYLTDQLLAAGRKSGYIFDSTPGSGSAAALQFSVQATPALSVGPSASGTRSYYGDESAVIRFSQTGTADTSSPPIQ
jgi:type IV pilus assembly protein PilA